MNKKTLICLAGLLSSIFWGLFLFSTNVLADAFESIDVLLNQMHITINGNEINYDNFKYNDSVYVPLAQFAKLMDKDVGWDEDSQTITVTDKASFSLPDNIEVHAFYANGSFSQFNAFYQNKSLTSVDTISYGWSRIDLDQNGMPYLNTTAQNNNDFNIPLEFQSPLGIAKELNLRTQLNVFANQNFSLIFENRDELIKSIVKILDGDIIYNENISFDGVVIDFEDLPAQYRDVFIDFISELRSALKDKNLYIAVPTENSSLSYDYHSIGLLADRVILMAHDYDAKYLPADYPVLDNIFTPLSPIKQVENTVKYIIENGNIESDKILLQINFSTTQWKIQNGSLYDEDGNNISTPYKPYYSTLYDRIKSELDSGIPIDSLIYFDSGSSSPFVRYTNTMDSTENIIWYEDARSLIKKLELVDKYGLGGISIWRLGNIPDFYNPNKQEIYLDIWSKLQEYLGR